MPQDLLGGRPNIFKRYEELFGKGVSPLIAERLKEYETTHTQECVDHCFVEAAEQNARTVTLVYTILDRHKAEGCYARRPTAGKNAGQSRSPSGAGRERPSEKARRLGIGVQRR